MAEVRSESASISKAQAVVTTTYCDMQGVKDSKVVMSVVGAGDGRPWGSLGYYRPF